MDFSSVDLKALLPEPYSIPFWIMVTVVGVGIAQLANAISNRLAAGDIEEAEDGDLEAEEDSDLDDQDEASEDEEDPDRDEP